MSYNPTLPAGQNTSSASSPVVLATDQTSIPIKNTVTTLYRASAAGTGISINDELQRVDLWDTSVSPVTLTSTRWYNNNTAANLASAPVLTSIYPVIGGILGTNGLMTDASGTITVGGTAQVLLASNSSRQGWMIQNTSNDDLFINDTGTATVISYRLPPGAEYNPTGVNTSAISIFGATTGQTFYCKSWNLPALAGSTLFVQGAIPAGQQVSANSYPVAIASDQSTVPVSLGTGQAVSASSVPVVLASNQTTSVSTTWFANVAGTGYSIGNILSQVIQNDAGTVRTTWFNLTTSAIIATPAIANLSLYNNTQSYKSKATWYVGGGSSIINSTANMIVVKNTYGFPVKVVSFSISMANNIYASTTTAQIMGVGFAMIIGSTTTVGGSAPRNTTKLVSSTYSNDSSITSQIGVTSITGGTQFDLGSLVISCPAIGPQTSVSDNGPGPADITLLKGIIIPTNSMLLVSGVTVGSTPLTPAGLFNCVLTEEL